MNDERSSADIGRVNSTQSIRIRNLEAEAALMLSENITLRKENIRLQHALESSGVQTALDHVDSVKAKLNAKMTELAELMSELGAAQSVLPRPEPMERLAQRRTPKCSPNQRTWKNAATLAEEAEQEGRLPPIVEDKYFPRRTLE